jgi:hypothetical protein
MGKISNWGDAQVRRVLAADRHFSKHECLLREKKGFDARIKFLGLVRSSQGLGLF